MRICVKCLCVCIRERVCVCVFMGEVVEYAVGTRVQVFFDDKAVVLHVCVCVCVYVCVF